MISSCALAAGRRVGHDEIRVRANPVQRRLVDHGGILLAILAPLVWIYRRDAGELPWYLRIGLPLLRTLVLIGLLVVYLNRGGGASERSMSTVAC